MFPLVAENILREKEWHILQVCRVMPVEVDLSESSLGKSSQTVSSDMLFS